MKKLVVLLMISALVVPAMASNTTVTELLPSTATPVAGSWYLSDVRPGGTASIVDFTGLGGNLENGQPLSTGAVKLTTDLTNAAKAEIGTFGDFGIASATLRNISLGYSFYKQSVDGGNTFAAPSIKLTIYAEGGTGDNYGTLVYEPYWNNGNQAISPTNAWQTVSIDSSTGAGVDALAGWTWNGGFGIGSGAGGPPIRSLAEWVAAFTTADGADFANAHIVGLSMGVGSYNPGQIGYFDNVSILTSDMNVSYDFEVPAVVPVPGAVILGSIGVAFVGWFKKRKSL